MKGMMMASVDLVQAEGDVEGMLDKALPWVGSFAMHLAVGLVAVFALYVAMQPVVVEEKRVPPVSFLPQVDPNAKNMPKDKPNEELLKADVSVESMQNMFKDKNLGIDPKGEAESLKKSLSGLGMAEKSDVLLIGPGQGGTGNVGVGIGTEIGGRAKFGHSNQIGSTVVFPDVRAKRVVYLLDHSGSMLDSFDHLRREVKSAVTNLNALQRYSVIMFSEEVTPLTGAQLVRATEVARKDMEKGLDQVRAMGQNDGLLVPFQKGFEKAFAMKPEVIVFLTDGEFDPRLVEVVKGLNKSQGGGKVVVQTIAFVNIGPVAAESLKTIATENGGSYKFVSGKDLEK
jgi:hypothetical protein